MYIYLKSILSPQPHCLFACGLMISNPDSIRLSFQPIVEFFNFLKNEIDTWEHDKMKENEEKVLNAVRILFESAEDIEIFNKKAIYLYMREITGLNTKQVVNNLNKMRVRYAVFRKKWDKGEL